MDRHGRCDLRKDQHILWKYSQNMTLRMFSNACPSTQAPAKADHVRSTRPQPRLLGRASRIRGQPGTQGLSQLRRAASLEERRFLLPPRDQRPGSGLRMAAQRHSQRCRRGTLGRRLPRYVWYKHGVIVFEGRLVNRGNGLYKGYPLDSEEWPDGIEEIYAEA